MSLQLKACSLMKAALNNVILFNFFRSILYKTERLRQLRRVIASTFALVEYIYIAKKIRM